MAPHPLSCFSPLSPRPGHLVIMKLSEVEDGEHKYFGVAGGRVFTLKQLIDQPTVHASNNVRMVLKVRTRLLGCLVCPK